MTVRQIAGYAGSVLLLLGILAPVAYLNGHTISFLPVWNNIVLDGGLWNWRDISFFAASAFILIMLSAAFTYKKKFSGLVFTGFLLMFIIALLFLTILQVRTKFTGISEITFSISYGWLFLVLGVIAILWGGLKHRF